MCRSSRPQQEWTNRRSPAGKSDRRTPTQKRNGSLDGGVGHQLLLGELLISKRDESNAISKRVLVDFTRGYTKHHAILVVDVSDDFVAIEQQGQFHRCVADSLVPVLARRSGERRQKKLKGDEDGAQANCRPTLHRLEGHPGSRRFPKFLCKVEGEDDARSDGENHDRSKRQ